MRRILLNSVQLNSVTINSVGERWRGSHAGAPPVVPDVPDIPEEPDVPINPDVDENGYIIFADPEVQRICAENWGDGTGITEAQAAAVTSLGRKFRANANIKYFDELQYFTSLTALGINNTSDTYAEFLNCASLERIILPTSVKTIWWHTFSGCTKLESINLENVEYIEGSAFYGVGEIKANLSNVTHCGERAFQNSKVSSVIFGKTSYVAGGSYNSGSFQNCTNLKEVDLTGVEEIKGFAFDGCSSLRTIINTNNVTTIGSYAFRAIGGATLSFPALKTLGGTAVFMSSSIVKVDSLGLLAEIPDGTYNSGVFQACKDLEYVAFPSTLEYIGSYAFNGCTALKDLDFTNVKRIGNRAFSSVAQKDFYAPNLEEIGYAFGSYSGTSPALERVLSLGKITTLPSGSYNVGAFNSCKNLRVVILPKTLTTLGDAEGNFTYCPKLEVIVCKATTPPTYGNNLYDSGSTFKVFVPLASLEDYKTATGWSGVASRIYAIEDILNDFPDIYKEVGEYL